MEHRNTQGDTEGEPGKEQKTEEKWRKDESKAETVPTNRAIGDADRETEAKESWPTPWVHAGSPQSRWKTLP